MFDLAFPDRRIKRICEQLQWAQNTSDATPSVIITDSYLLATRVA